MTETSNNDRAVRVSVQVQPQHATYQQMRDAWMRAEEIGADVIFNWDHFFPLRGDADGLHFECWTLLAAMAEATERPQLGALVTCNSYRNPQLLADMARTVDHISGGRCILGIGSGWAERDYFQYEYEFGTAGSRLRDLDAALPKIKDRFGKLNPGPVNGHLPILIGGGGEKVTLKLVAKHGDAWHSFGDAEIFKRKDAILREHCANEGRDSDEIERTWGTRDLGPAELDELAELGVRQFIAGIGGDGSGYDLKRLRELIAWRDKSS